jgi:ABC-type enterochelin transport system ATPase subunit
MDAVAQAPMMQALHHPSPNALGVQRLTLHAGSRTLLDGFTHTFSAGEIWCIAGPNGAGKTTLLSTLAGLRQPSAGHVELDGVRLHDWQPLPLAQRRALMPQSAPDAFSASVLDIVMLNRFPHLNGWGWERAADRDAAHAALDCWALPLSPRAMCFRYRAASVNGWRWQRCCVRMRRFCCSTNRCRISICIIRSTALKRLPHGRASHAVRCCFRATT